jgi:hypothetical protein
MVMATILIQKTQNILIKILIFGSMLKPLAHGCMGGGENPKINRVWRLCIQKHLWGSRGIALKVYSHADRWKWNSYTWTIMYCVSVQVIKNAIETTPFTCFFFWVFSVLIDKNIPFSLFFYEHGSKK